MVGVSTHNIVSILLDLISRLGIGLAHLKRETVPKVRSITSAYML